MIDAAVQTAIVAELKPCRLTARDVTIHFDDELQSTVVTIRQSAKVDASSFICIRQALWAKADVNFEDARTQELYHAFDRELGRAEGRAVARAWLNQRGLLTRLPSFTPDEPVASVIAKIERFCGVVPGTAFEERYAGFVSIKREFLTMPPQPATECLFNTMAAIDADRLGFKFGFIGNEAAAKEIKN